MTAASGERLARRVDGRSWWGSGWREAVDAVFPRSCYLCGGAASDEVACEEHALPEEPGGVRCPRCAARMPRAVEGAAKCADCARHSPGVERLIVLADYRRHAAMREWILAFKHGGRSQLALPMGRALARLASSELGANGRRDVLVPVPLHAWRRLERGYDQAALLAEAIGAASGVPVARALVRARPTAVQGGVGAVSRQANVRGAFRASRVAPLARRRVARADVVWLVDDVVTSGSTLRECARAVRRLGARRVAALALARASRAPVEEVAEELDPSAANDDSWHPP